LRELKVINIKIIQLTLNTRVNNNNNDYVGTFYIN
jgi:hypothetical protein